MPTPGDISLYFHIPFCKRKCPYCHFYSTVEESHDLYLEALFLEWERVKHFFETREVVSIYFGGGTPSLLGSKIQEILSWISSLTISPSCEITIETNPEDVTCEKIASFKAYGINRVSLGVQSFDDELLKVLGRGHSAQEAIDAIKTIEECIPNVSIDLMYEVPLQTEKSWKNTLNLLASCPISHLSLYNLTFEEKTPFFYRKDKLLPEVPSEKTALVLLEQAQLSLGKMGLHQYEISAFAKKGMESRHNLGYWTGREFWGFGPSAFSYFKGKRSQNVSSLQAYAKKLKNEKSPVSFEEQLPYPRNLLELLAINLRVLEGVNLERFQEMRGIIPKETMTSLNELETSGFLERTNEKIKLSQKGFLFYDLVAESIIE